MKTTPEIQPQPNSEDKSRPLAIIFTEQQWLEIGGLISEQLEKHLIPEPVSGCFYPIALKIQQTLNRLWLIESKKSNGLPVLNFCGKQIVDNAYLFGAELPNLNLLASRE